jgi:CBS domain-containing protein
MYAQEIMVEPIITCQSTESLADAARKLWDHDCGALPIVNDEGILVGMLTDRDICMAALTQGKLLPDMAIPHAMSKVVYAVTATTPGARGQGVDGGAADPPRSRRRCQGQADRDHHGERSDPCGLAVG